MRTSATLLVSTITVASLAAVLSVVPTGEAAEECVAKPTSTAPRGSHWYYRLERGTGRRCWYLGAEGEKVQARQSTSSPRRTPLRPAGEGDAEPRPAERTTVAADNPAPPLQWAGMGAAGVAAIGYGAPRPPTSSIEGPAPVEDVDDMPPVWPPLAPEQSTASAASSPPDTAVPLEYVLACLTGALALAAFITGRIAASRRKPRPGRGARLETSAPQQVPQARQQVPLPQELRATRAPARATPQEDDLAVPAFLLRPPPWRAPVPVSTRHTSGDTRAPVWRSERVPIVPADHRDDDIERRLERLLEDWRRAAA
jgi:hypothetical protein